MKKNVIFGLLVFLCMFGCQNSETDDSVVDEYNSFKNGCVEAQAGNTVSATVNGMIYIELQDSAIPYEWVYSVDNTNVVLVDKKTFNFNDEGVIGGPVQYILRFKCTATGTSMITFKRQGLGNPADVIDTKQYTVSIK